MPLVFMRKADPQRSLFDPTVAGRSFERNAHRIPASSTDEMLRQRLAELDLKRRRAQIRARKVVDAPEPAPVELPFMERAAA